MENTGNTMARSPFPIVHTITKVRQTLLDALSEWTPVEEARFLIEFGSVYLNKKRVLKDCEVEKGHYLRIHLEPKRFRTVGIAWSDRVIFDDSNFLIINKPPNIPVHATLDNAFENTLHLLSKHLKTPLYVTHRIDVGTQGLLVFAKSKSFQSKFNEWLLKRKILKKYRAYTKNEVTPGHYCHYQNPATFQPREMSFSEKPGWLLCEMRIHESKSLTAGFENDVELMTGRTHQIRAQLSLLGSPIIGDELYKGDFDKFLRLQSYYLKIPDFDTPFILPATDFDD